MPYKDGWHLGNLGAVVLGLIKLIIFIFLIYFFYLTTYKIYETNTIVKDIQKTLKDKK